jgi:hypothetical protein
LFVLATDPTRDGLDQPVTKDTAVPEDRSSLNAKAARCRRLAAGISDRQASDVLSSMARSYQAAADRLEPQG